jgi:hypothetical protein
MRFQRGSKSLHYGVENAADQRFLGWKVIVERRDVDPDLTGDVSRPQTLKTMLGDLIERRLDQLLASLFGNRARANRPRATSRPLHAG